MKPNGAAIKSIREARGLRLRRLAHLAGIDPGFLCRLEKEKRGWSPETREQIAKALDSPVEAITKGEAP